MINTRMHAKQYALTFIEQEQKKGKKTKMWSLWKESEKYDCMLLGTVLWKGAWRQYVFEPAPETCWSKGCLEFVVQFLGSINSMQRVKHKVNLHGR